MKHVKNVSAQFQDDPPDWDGKTTFRRVLLSEIDGSVHPKMREACEAASQWSQARNSGNRRASLVLIAGPSSKDGNATGYGCGKTHIATASLHCDCWFAGDEATSPVGKFYDSSELMEEMGKRQSLSNIAKPDTIMVIDDVGAEQTLEYVAAGSQEAEMQSLYFRIINWCYEQGVSVIITGNLGVADLMLRIGGRAWSRLQQMCPPGCIVDMTGVPDYRLTLRKS